MSTAAENNGNNNNDSDEEDSSEDNIIYKHKHKHKYDDDDDDDFDSNNHNNNITINNTNNNNNNNNNNNFLKLDLIEKLMLLLAGSSIFLFAGAYYGWGPMQLLLEENGNFNSKCTTTEQQQQEVCEEQTQALLNVRFYSQLTLFASPILGIISDRYGSTTICLLMSIFAIVGIILLIVSTSADTTTTTTTTNNNNNLDWLLYVAFSCIGLASVGYGMMTVETGVVFDGPQNLRLRSRIISAMNSLYDAGAVTYWILWGIGQLLDDRVTLSQLASGYLIVAILCLGGYWYLFRKVVIIRRRRGRRSNNNNNEEQRLDDNDNNNNNNNNNSTVKKRGELVHSKTATTTKEFDVSSRSEIIVVSMMKNDDDETDISSDVVVVEEKLDPTTTTTTTTENIDEDLAFVVVVNTSTNDETLGKPPPTTTTVEEESVGDVRSNDDTINNSKIIPSTIAEEEENIIAATVIATTPTTTTTTKKAEPSSSKKCNNDGSNYIKIADRPFKEQMKSSLFLLLATFFSFHQTSNIWTLTTARDFLKYLGDDETGNKYLTIFTLLTPVSLLGLPFVDIAIHRYGFHTALQCINILAIIHGSIKVASPNLNVQIVGFLVFSFFRCFLFAVSLSCLPTFVSQDTTGRAVSVLYCISGALCFLNIPFARLALDYGDGNFFLPNMLYLIMTFPMIVVTWQLGKKLKLDNDTQPETMTAVSS